MLVLSTLTDIKKEIKNVGQRLGSQSTNSKRSCGGKAKFRDINRAKVKADDVAEDVRKDL